MATPNGGTKLYRSTPGTLSSYTHEVEVILDPHRLGGGAGTQADFKLKSFGVDGFMEIVLKQLRWTCGCTTIISSP